MLTVLLASALASCIAIDGDTLRCGRERVRLIGIDAPELPGHCRRGRRCVAGDAVASTRSLAAGLVAPIRIRRLGRDRYGRTLALVSGAHGDLSCWQLRRGQAAYRPDWDDGGQVGKLCPINRPSSVARQLR